jgi:hypothetical protein
VANGISCCSRAECLEIVLEHEIVHMLVRLFCPHSGRSHGKNFMTIARGVFGHKDFYHSLHRGDGMEILADQDAGVMNKNLIRKLMKKGGNAWIKYRKVRISDAYGAKPVTTDHIFQVKSVGPRNIILQNGERIRHGNYHIVGIYQDKDGENLMKWSEEFQSEGSEEEEEEEYPSWIERDSDGGDNESYGD